VFKLQHYQNNNNNNNRGFFKLMVLEVRKSKNMAPKSGEVLSIAS
jgi:hypothetical protein